MIDLLCPKCYKPAYSLLHNKHCTEDGTSLIPFSPQCTCGEYIDTFYSYAYTYHKRFIFWGKGNYYPEALHDYCSKCGKPIKVIYKQYLKQWQGNNKI